MRIITIDEGNSKTNVAIFNNGNLELILPFNQFQPHPTDIIILSSVKKNSTIHCHFNLKDFHQNNSFFNMPVDYAETLGIDRLIAGYFAYSKQSNAVVIDAGTFITIDYISQNGIEGGFIFPGINCFLESYTRGSLLPNLNFLDKNVTLPHNTEDAILGATNIYLESILKETIKKFSPCKLYLTGGNSEVIKNKIEKINLVIELDYQETFLHQGMYLIYLRHLKDLKVP